MSLDTSPDAAAVRLRALRAMSGPARLAQALDMSETVRALWEHGRRDRAARAVRDPEEDASGPSVGADPAVAERPRAHR